MEASTTAFVSAVVGSLLSSAQSAITTLFSSYVGIFFTLIVGVAVITGIAHLIKRAPRAVFGSH